MPFQRASKARHRHSREIHGAMERLCRLYEELGVPLGELRPATGASKAELAGKIVMTAEQIKVASPGVNNTTEVLLMGAIAIIQVVLFALAAAKVQSLAIFDNTEFLLLTIINMAQTAVAYQINSATLMRTITEQ